MVGPGPAGGADLTGDLDREAGRMGPSVEAVMHIDTVVTQVVNR